jgi:hypothetical protein
LFRFAQLFLNRITGFLDLQDFCFAKAKLNLQDFPQNTVKRCAKKTLCNLVPKPRATSWEKHRETPCEKPTVIVSLRSTFLNRITGFLDLQDFCFAKAKLDLQDFCVKHHVKKTLCNLVPKPCATSWAKTVKRRAKKNKKNTYLCSRIFCRIP